VHVNVPEVHTGISGPGVIAGNAFTVNVVVVEHDPAVYVIVDVPADTAVTRPVDEFIVAYPGLLLHTPPEVASLRVVVDPAHKVVVPVIGAGPTSTVIIFDAIQPPTV